MAVGDDYEEITYIDGVSGDDACRLVASDEAVAAVALLLRRYHDIVAEWRPEVSAGLVRRPGRHRPRMINSSVTATSDPWNLVWRDGRLVGLIDWEYATIGTRRTDIAYALHYLAPFRDRSYWRGILGLQRRPRRRHRMAVFAEAYGIEVDDQLVDEVLDFPAGRRADDDHPGRARTAAATPADRRRRAGPGAAGRGLDGGSAPQVPAAPERLKPFRRPEDRRRPADGLEGRARRAAAPPPGPQRDDRHGRIDAGQERAAGHPDDLARAR